MHTHTTLTVLAIVAAVTLVVGAVAAPLIQPVDAAKDTTTKKITRNNQQNDQGAFNFNNQQFQSNFQCFGCNP